MDKSSRIYACSLDNVRGNNEHFSAIQNSGDFDNSAKVTARSLCDKMMSIDFALSMMFMKNVMPKTKQMTEALQAEELNIVDAMS